MKTALAILLFTGIAAAQGIKPKTDGTVLMEASLSIAKKVCAAHPEADVWIFMPPATWKQLPCANMAPAFVADDTNPFDGMIPIMQGVDDARAAAPVAKRKTMRK